MQSTLNRQQGSSSCSSLSGGYVHQPVSMRDLMMRSAHVVGADSCQKVADRVPHRRPRANS